MPLVRECNRGIVPSRANFSVELTLRWYICLLKVDESLKESLNPRPTSGNISLNTRANGNFSSYGHRITHINFSNSRIESFFLMKKDQLSWMNWKLSSDIRTSPIIFPSALVHHAIYSFFSYILLKSLVVLVLLKIFSHLVDLIETKTPSDPTSFTVS